jgi:hypothetical protein
MSDIPTIAKEQIAALHFVSYEVLDDEAHKRARRAELEKAMILGNGDHGKARIVFVSQDGVHEVETTVWATTDETITLKGGVTIPIHCISQVSFT